MAASAGFATTLYTAAAGDSTAFTQEACTKVTANTVYRITSAAKRIWDPSEDITVEVDATGTGSWVAASSTAYRRDWLFGTITFTADQGSSALVRVSGFYFPRHALAVAKSTDFKVSRDMLDTTVFSTDGAPGALAGLLRASGSLEVIEQEPLIDDSETFGDKLDDGDWLIVEVRPGGTGNAWRAHALPVSHSSKADGAGLATGTLEWQAVGNALVTGTAAYASDVHHVSFGPVT